MKVSTFFPKRGEDILYNVACFFFIQITASKRQEQWIVLFEENFEIFGGFDFFSLLVWQTVKTFGYVHYLNAIWLQLL